MTPEKEVTARFAYVTITKFKKYNKWSITGQETSRSKFLSAHGATIKEAMKNLLAL